MREKVRIDSWALSAETLHEVLLDGPGWHRNCKFLLTIQAKKALTQTIPVIKLALYK